MNAAPYLALLRHGHSEWNLSDRFTGWSDVALTEVGIGEAVAAGRALAEAGYVFDEMHGSILHRARQTAQVLMQAMDAPALPFQASWRLNERHYGALQGMNKQQIFATWGAEASRRWWRGYAERPPPLAFDDPRHPRLDPLYLGLAPEVLPASESLRDCQQRVLPYWQSVVWPRVREGRRVLLIGHGNTLRALLMHLEGIDVHAVEHLEIPSGVPRIYRLGPDAEIVDAAWLESGGGLGQHA